MTFLGLWVLIIEYLGRLSYRQFLRSCHWAGIVRHKHVRGKNKQADSFNR